MCEGMHSALKKVLLNRARGNLLTVYEASKTLSFNHLVAIESQLSCDKKSFPTETIDRASSRLYAHLRGKISRHALTLIMAQEELARQAAATATPLPSCTRKFYHSMGLPCKHMIADCLSMVSH